MTCYLVIVHCSLDDIVFRVEKTHADAVKAVSSFELDQLNRMIQGLNWPTSEFTGCVSIVTVIDGNPESKETFAV